MTKTHNPRPFVNWTQYAAQTRARLTPEPEPVPTQPAQLAQLALTIPVAPRYSGPCESDLGPNPVGCRRPARVLLYRTDREDRTGAAFCSLCAAQAVLSGEWTDLAGNTIE